MSEFRSENLMNLKQYIIKVTKLLITLECQKGQRNNEITLGVINAILPETKTDLIQ